MRIVDAISEVGDGKTWYPRLSRVFGLIESIFLVYFIGWHGRQRDNEGWIYKKSNEIEEELGITYKQQIRIRKQLELIGVLESKFRRNEGITFYRINIENINNLYAKFYGIQGESDKEASDQMSDAHMTKGHITNNRASIYITSNNQGALKIEKYDPYNADLPFESNSFKECWKDWCSYRKEKRQPLSQFSVRLQLKMFKEIGELSSIDAIKTSMLNGWTGLFPSKAIPKKTPKPIKFNDCGKIFYDVGGVVVPEEDLDSYLKSL